MSSNIIEEEKKLWCCSCEDEIVHEFLQCDKCGRIMCQGVNSGSCWHNHLQSFHEIDWTISFMFDETALDEMKTIKGYYFEFEEEK